MSYIRLSPALAAVFLVASGCQSNTAERVRPISAAENERASTAAPPEDPRRVRFLNALRGLRFAEDGVVIDAQAAADVLPELAASGAVSEYQRGLALAGRNAFTGSVGAFRNVILLAPDSAAAYLALGRVLTIKGKAVKAIAALRTAVAKDSASVEARFRLGWALQAAGRLDGAIEAWCEVLRLDPDHGETHRRLAIALYYTGEPAAAWRHVRRAEALGEPAPPQFLELLAGRTPTEDAP